MHAVRLLLKPLTPLLFRKPMPFGIGGEAYTRYPLPVPTQIAGMIRSALMDAQNLSRPTGNGLLGNPSRYDFKWTLVGPYLAVESGDGGHTLYYPMPLDVLCCELDTREADGGEGGSPVRSRDRSGRGSRWKIRLADTGWAEKLKPKGYEFFGIPKALLDGERLTTCEPCGGFISLRGLEKYAEGRVPACEDILRWEDMRKYVAKKPAMGIRLEPESKTVAMGYTFTYERVHFRDGVGIAVMLLTEDRSIANGLESLGGKKARLGGKGGIVEIEVKERDELEFFEDRYLNAGNQKLRGRVKVVYTAPAVLDAGGRASTVPQPHRSELKGFGAGTEWISGWDYAINAPKPSYLAVKEGSVYYYEFPDDGVPLKDVVFDRIFVMSDFKRVLGSNIVVGRW